MARDEASRDDGNAFTHFFERVDRALEPVFTNPPGDHAGRLIEVVGLKGHTLGRAQVSTLHANWIVNLGGATARDVLGLVTLMQQRVREETGVDMKPEVKRLGAFLP